MGEHAYPPALHAAVHTGNPGDIGFYVRACAGVDPVLELGCGVGRLGRRLVEAGHEVVGLDHDRGALTLASAAGIITVAADMRRFRIRRRFARIIIPYNGLYCLLSERALVECLRSTRRHLAPGGQVIFDAYAGDRLDDAILAAASGQDERVASVTVEGRRWDVFERSVICSSEQRIDATYTHVPREGGEPVRATIRQRYLKSHQIPELLSRAGLALASLQGGFHGETFARDSPYLVVRAERWTPHPDSR